MTAGKDVAAIVRGGAVVKSAATQPGGSSGDSSGGGFSLGDLADPAKFAGDVLGAIFAPIEQNALRMLLYVVLIGGGVALLVTGSLRATKGTRQEAH
jgi:hypothetical protein